MGCDLDQICGYSTQRIAKIRDRRLGMLYYFFILSIAAYIIGFEIVVKQGYKLQGAVIGTARLQLKAAQPPWNRNESALPYCGTGRYPSPIAPTHTMDRLECKFWREHDAVFPPLESGSSFLTTRVTELYSTLTKECETFDTPQCDYEPAGNTSYYIGNTEYFTVLLDHTMSVPSLGMSRNSIDMSGSLEDDEGHVFDPCDAYPPGQCPSYVDVDAVGKPDILPLRSLLAAAHLDTLDRPSSDRGALASEFLRYSGGIIVIEISYNNYFSFNSSAVRYTYRVSTVANTEFKSEQPLPAPGWTPANRTVVNRHGIRIVVKQTGRIGKFDFQTLLIQLVSSIGLLAVATLVVDTVAVNCLPDRKLYAQYKVRETVDFHDLHNGQVNVRSSRAKSLGDSDDMVDMLPGRGRRGKEPLLRGVPKYGSREGGSKDGDSSGMMLDLHEAYQDQPSAYS